MSASCEPLKSQRFGREREMAVGYRCTEADFASQLQGLGLDRDVFEWCLDFLRSDGFVLQEAGLEIELVDFIER